MRLLIAFLVVAFCIGGTAAGGPIRQRWYLMLGGCLFVSALYYNYRVVR